MSRRYITLVVSGDDGDVERRYTINAEDRAAKLDVLRGWASADYESLYGFRPRDVNVSDWPLLGGERPVHGVENVTFRFPEGVAALGVRSDTTEGSGR
jgi:hypothetical protein